MAIAWKGKRRIDVDGETFLWRHWAGGAHVVDLHGRLDVYCIGGVALVKGPRFRAVKGCGGLHRCFRCPDFFAVTTYPRYVATCVRWCVAQGPDPTEVDRQALREIMPPMRRTPAEILRTARCEADRAPRRAYLRTRLR